MSSRKSASVSRDLATNQDFAGTARVASAVIESMRKRRRSNDAPAAAAPMAFPGRSATRPGDEGFWFGRLIGVWGSNYGSYRHIHHPRESISLGRGALGGVAWQGGDAGEFIHRIWCPAFRTT